MELAGLTVWQAVCVLTLAVVATLESPSGGYAAGTFIGVTAVLWMLVYSIRSGLNQPETNVA